jgi:hypothetical protein
MTISPGGWLESFRESFHTPPMNTQARSAPSTAQASFEPSVAQRRAWETPTLTRHDAVTLTQGTLVGFGPDASRLQAS